jgi:subtilisin family serine protease
MLTLPNKNRVYIESISRYPLNGDGRIYMRLLPGDLDVIEPGDWELILIGVEVYDGSFHAWIDTAKQDGEPVPKFFGPYADEKCTISIPGTASKIITVGSFFTHPFVPGVTADIEAQLNNLVGTLAPNSSFGPTRDGRPKPEITAPGEAIISARKGKNDEDQYFIIGGTSMSAPHVTGAVALLLEKKPTLTHAEVKDILCRCARTDTHTSSPPEGWGAGKLDVLACHESIT